MDRDALRRIIHIAEVADGSCSSCCLGCIQEAIEQFPEEDWRGLAEDDPYWPEPDYVDSRKLLMEELAERTQ